MDNIALALKNLDLAYAPYSGFKVSAILRCNDGSLYRGVNIENSSYSATNCAERTAFFTALADGQRHFKSITLVSSEGKLTPPCGVCRQVMAEFCEDDFEIILARKDGTFEIFKLKDLLPLAFDLGGF